MEGINKTSQLVLHNKTAVITEDLSVEVCLLPASSHSSSSSSPSNHAQGQDIRHDKGEPRIKGDSTVIRKLTATVDTAAVEGGSGTGKTGYSTRTRRKHKTATRKRQHGEFRLILWRNHCCEFLTIVLLALDACMRGRIVVLPR